MNNIFVTKCVAQPHIMLGSHHSVAGLVVNILTYRHRKETTSRAFSWASITRWSNYHSFTYKYPDNNTDNTVQPPPPTPLSRTLTWVEIIIIIIKDNRYITFLP